MESGGVAGLGASAGSGSRRWEGGWGYRCARLLEIYV